MEKKPAKDFRDLIVWQKAHQYVISTYHFSDSFPKGDIFQLMSQLEEVSKLLEAYTASILAPDS